RLQEIFEEAIGTGHEGVIAKAVHKDATYQAGSRSWLWARGNASPKPNGTCAMCSGTPGWFRRMWSTA
ncbi:MAG: hypothetical protein KAJ05_01060, partial [Candidatus Latescibacteria bacterium]|nr:hypothetical protein [Candidatus Latescibacterota bacterium]